MDSTLLGGFCSKRRIVCAPALLPRQVLFVPKPRVALGESHFSTTKCIFAHGVSADVSWQLLCTTSYAWNYLIRRFDQMSGGWPSYAFCPYKPVNTQPAQNQKTSGDMSQRLSQFFCILKHRLEYFRPRCVTFFKRAFCHLSQTWEWY